MQVAIRRDTVAGMSGGPVIVVSVSGEIDLLTSPFLYEHLDRALDDPEAFPVVVDMSAVTFFSSSGIAVLAEARSVSLERGVLLQLVIEPGSPPDRSLQMMAMTNLLVIQPNLDAAIHAAGADGATHG